MDTNLQNPFKINSLRNTLFGNNLGHLERHFVRKEINFLSSSTRQFHSILYLQK